MRLNAARSTKRLVEKYRKLNKELNLNTESVLKEISSYLDPYVAKEIQLEKEENEDYRKFMLEMEAIEREPPIGIQI